MKLRSGKRTRNHTTSLTLGRQHKKIKVQHTSIYDIPLELLVVILKEVCWELEEALDLRLVCKLFNEVVVEYVTPHLPAVVLDLVYSPREPSYSPSKSALELSKLFPKLHLSAYSNNDLFNPFIHQTLLKDMHVFRSIRFLRDSGLRDVQPLSHMQAVSLGWCCNLTNVAPLAKVREVILDSCLQLSDVSALGSVHTLKIFNCTLITDVSALSMVHCLTLENLDGVEDVSTLGTVHELHLLELPMVEDVSKLGTVKDLTLMVLPCVTDVSTLGGVEKLTLFYMNGITSIKGLETVPKLLVNNCENITTIPAPQNCITWCIANCPKVTKVEQSPFHIQSICLSNLPLRDFAPLSSVSKVAVISGIKRRHVSDFLCLRGCIPTLVLDIPFLTETPWPELHPGQHTHYVYDIPTFTVKYGHTWLGNGPPLPSPTCEECEKGRPVYIVCTWRDKHATCQF